MAVAIVIDKGASGSPSLAGTSHAGFVAYIGKRAVAVVAIQNILAVIGDVEVDPAVIVVVTHTNALAPSGVGQPRLFRDVAEGAVMIVAIQMVRRSFSRGESLEFGPIDDENVRPAIVVVVENRNARPGRFDDVLLCVLPAENIHHGESGFLRGVSEVRQRLG